MKSTLVVFVTGLIVAMFLAGCGGGGGGSSAGSFGSGDNVVGAGLSGGSDSGDSGSGSILGGSSGSSGSSVASALIHTPEPATYALLGSGLFAYAFFKRRRERK